MMFSSYLHHRQRHQHGHGANFLVVFLISIIGLYLVQSQFQSSSFPLGGIVSATSFPELSDLSYYSIYESHFLGASTGNEACPVCHNGAPCNETSGTCQCAPLYWKNDEDEGVKDCSLQTCGLGSGPDQSNFCDCAGSGFDFINCMGCETDDACNQLHHHNTTNSTMSWYCSKDLLPVKNKNFFCDVTQMQTREIIGSNATFECVGLQNRANVSETIFSQCDFQSWATDLPQKPTGYLQQVFDCSFSNCTYYYTEHQLVYLCAKTDCKCMVDDGWVWKEEPMYCANPMIKPIVQSMKGSAHVTCDRLIDPTTKKPTFLADRCVITQEDLDPLGFYFELSGCKGRECHFGPYSPPPPEDLPPTYWWLSLVIAGGTVLFVLAAILLAGVHSFIHTKRVTLEYRCLKGKTFGAKLEITDLSYFLDSSNGLNKLRGVKPTQILHNVSHTIYPGQVVALMGPSGAGKTTLLDILAGRNKKGIIKGHVKLNDRKYDSSFKRIAGYVSQEDNLMGTQTVKESLRFSADLKLPSCVSSEEKDHIVEDVMAKLKISHIAHRKIGGALKRGISGGERRRVAVGMELVGQPHILFLDEPTSGLDAHSAYTVIHELVLLAKNEGRTIVFSIHQPRTNIFNEFDELMLLSKGRLVYVGAAEQAESHFNSMGYNFPQKTNIADSLIDLIVQSEHEDVDLRYEVDGHMANGYGTAVSGSNIQYSPNTYQNGAGRSDIEPAGPQSEQINPTSKGKSGEGVPLLAYADKGNSADARMKSSNYHLPQFDNYYRDQMIPYATSFYSQLWVLSKRAFWNFLRNFYLMPAHFGSAIILGLLLGFIYWQQDNNLKAIQNRLGCLFFMCSLLSFMAMSSLELFISERQIYVAERGNGYYTSSAYFFSKVLFDIVPLRILPAIMMGSIAYWMIDLRHGASHFLYFLLILTLFNIASGAQCIAIGAVAPSVAAANITTIVIILSSSLFGGFLLSKLAIPPWISWFQWLSLYNYALEALAVNELYDFPIIVDPVSVGDFKFPTVNAKGQFILSQFGLDRSRFAVDISALGAFSIFFLFLSMIMLTYFVREKR
eukprot:CAMPEP_0117450946 /NCGR_PEP_ID=MMETSP0759-20121206/8744_1 /TAXON_ID=63605 /ORGANISM="Percolomonas cosmopolitus, Strain WS" /LENGTH=1065 /DNA_ID=CAMNT_0005243511 /DNA_START=317 /DNA_END=3514 /DNA_ORIENTATION=-